MDYTKVEELLFDQPKNELEFFYKFDKVCAALDISVYHEDKSLINIDELFNRITIEYMTYLRKHKGMKFTHNKSTN